MSRRHSPRRAIAIAALGLTIGALAACTDDPASPTPRPAARRAAADSADSASTLPVDSVALPTDTVRVVVGRTLTLTAALRDSAGAALRHRAIAWSSSADSVLTVDSAGVVTGVALGVATVTAASEGKRATAVVAVHDASVYTLTVAPHDMTIVAGDTLPLGATPRDAQGAVVDRVAVRWTSGDTSVVAVDGASGVLRAVAAGRAVVTAAGAGRSDSVAVTVVPEIAGVRVLTALDTLEAYDTRQLAAVFVDTGGRVITHGPAVARRAIRWSSSDTNVARVDSVTGVLTGVDRGTVTISATSDTYTDSARSAARDTLVGTAKRVVVIRYRSVVTGTEHACDIASGGVAWCWGFNAKEGRIGLEQLGDTVKSAVPVRVPGGHRFVKLEAYGRTTCGLDAEGAAWCWGNNGWGMLARPTGTYQSATPLLVSPTLRFRALAVGDEHVCGIAADAKTYCWGYDGWGQFGNGKTGSSTTPTLALGGLELASVTAGGSFVCGVTRKGETYCAGYSGMGNLGDGGKISGGNTYLKDPSKVVGGNAFAQVRASNQYACALTLDGKAFCWGNNALNVLGAAAVSQSSTPVPVDGGLTFRSIATGYSHACGVTTASELYCWGNNKDGQLGTSALNGARSPARSAGALAVAEVSAANVSTGGAAFTCAVGADRLTTYCWGRNDKGQLGNGAVSALGTPDATPSIVVGQKPLPAEK